MNEESTYPDEFDKLVNFLRVQKLKKKLVKYDGDP